MISRILLLLLRAYQKTRFLRQPSCRFYPSCSQYMVEAIECHGVFMGLKLGTIRLCKCHPLNDGGVDEVPPSAKTSSQPELDSRTFSRFISHGINRGTR